MARRPRVRGLLRLRDRVRRELSRGLSPAARAALRREVDTELHRLDRELARIGARRSALPRPTRAALRELESLDFERAPAGGANLAGAFTLRGLVSGLRRLLRACGSTGVDPEQLRAAAGRLVAEAEELVALHGRGRQALARPTADALAGLADLAAPGAAEAAIATVAKARRLAEQERERQRRRDSRPLEIALARSTALWRVRSRPDRIEVDLSQAFVGAPDRVLRGLLAWALRREGTARSEIEQWLAEVRPSALAGAAPAKEHHPRGIAYDLEQVYAALNRTWFDGRLSRPVLAWTAVPTRQKFGAYTYASDRIVISSTLDSPRVPRFVLEYVLYHEMLHKALGFQRAGGRGRAHTREFREAERRFPQYAEAVKYLEQLGRRRG